MDYIDSMKKTINKLLDKELILANSYGSYVIDTPKLDTLEDTAKGIYDKMMLDPVVSSAIDLLKTKTLTVRPKLINPMVLKVDASEQLTNEDFLIGEEIKEFVENMINGFSLPFITILKELLNALVYGSVVAEKTFKLIDNKLIITDIKIKPRDNYKIVTDEFNNVKGVVDTLLYSSESSIDSLIPREKLIIYSHNPKYNNPYGFSLLRPAYSYWLAKKMIVEFYLKYIKLYAMPPIIGALPTNFARDENGKKLADNFLSSLVNLSNGVAMVHTGDSKVYNLQANSTDIFQKALKYFDDQMTICILKTTRATSEAQFGSKADSEVSNSIIKEIVSSLQESLASTLYDDIFFQVVALNWGVDYAKKYTPKIEFLDSDPMNLVRYAYSIAQLWGVNFLDESQVRALDEKMGLPPRSAVRTPPINNVSNVDNTQPTPVGMDNNMR